MISLFVLISLIGKNRCAIIIYFEPIVFSGSDNVDASKAIDPVEMVSNIATKSIAAKKTKIDLVDVLASDQ